MSRAVTFTVSVATLVTAACAAGPSKSRAPAATAPAADAAGEPQQQPQAYPQQPGSVPQPGYPPPPPAEPAPAPGQLGAGQPGGGAASRTMAFSSALDEVDSSQRQLDVAAGDCTNACRALGSMDRATGRLCGLAQGSDEGRRCEDAKRKVYSARDRVKQTCGTCPGGVSVERSAPIPSVR